MGIQHGDIGPENMMWDRKRKVGVLNDFDFAKLVGQTGVRGRDKTGTVPFMALDLVTSEGLSGGIPRRYRHEAESFSWSLIFLYLAVVKGEKGKNSTMLTECTSGWFEDWHASCDAKKGLELKDHDIPDVLLVYPNAKELADNLLKYWKKRYNSQFLRVDKGALRAEVERKVIPTKATAVDSTSYEELGDEDVFQQVAVEMMIGLYGLDAYETAVGMLEDYKSIDWDHYLT